MVEFFEAARRRMPGLKWTVLTQSDTTELLAHAGRLGLTSVITIGRVSPDDLLVALGRCSAGLCLYRRKRSAPACSPTKVPEYLAAGLPIVASRGVGDLDSIIGDSDQEPGESSTSHSPPIGVLVDEWGPGDFERAADELKPLLDDPHIRARCRSRARRYFDLEAIGWTRYRRIYGRVIGHPVPEKSMADAKCRPLGRSPGIDPVPAAEIGSIVD
jgi:glycosyltransferase involved in cell wall biosynthesis